MFPCRDPVWARPATHAERLGGHQAVAAVGRDAGAAKLAARVDGDALAGCLDEVEGLVETALQEIEHQRGLRNQGAAKATQRVDWDAPRRLAAL